MFKYCKGLRMLKFIFFIFCILFAIGIFVAIVRILWFIGSKLIEIISGDANKDNDNKLKEKITKLENENEKLKTLVERLEHYLKWKKDSKS